MSTLSNIDTVKIVGRSGGGPQITMQQKLTPDPECRTIVFESIPNKCTWGQVSRCNIPGGAVLTRANFFPVWKSVFLRFDCGLGANPGVAPAQVTGIAATCLSMLHAIESISIIVDQQIVHTVSNGAQGVIAQKYMDAVTKRMSEDVGDGQSANQYIYYMAREELDKNAAADKFLSYDPSDTALSMITNRGLDLALIFDGIFDECDPRMFGSELIVEVTMADMPPTLGGVHGSLLVYSTNTACDGTLDTRPLYHLANLRVEIEQQSFLSDPFPQSQSYEHTFFHWDISAQPVDMSAAGSVHRWYLGQIFTQRSHTRRLLLWCHSIPTPTDDGTLYNHQSLLFWKTNENWLGGGETWKLIRNGETIIDACDPIRLHRNSVQCQEACWGGVRLHHSNNPAGSGIWDYAKAAQVLLSLPGHPHKEQYDQVDVHTETPFGISNQSATEYAFEYTNQTAVPAGLLWRDEMYLVIESYKIVQFNVDRRTRRVGIASKLN